MTKFKDYFYGNKISEYGRKNGRVDYATLAKAFDAVLNNNIISATGWEYWEQESGQIDNSERIEEIDERLQEIEELIDYLYNEVEEIPNRSERVEELEAERTALEEEREELENEQDEQPEIFQYYIVDDNGARILEEFGEIVFYNSELDMYVWGVTHYGTGWSYVLTSIPCEVDEKARA